MLKAQIIVSLGVLMCGQILWWRRRDNIAAYFQVGLFFASVLIPVLGTRVLETSYPGIVGLYANILSIGAVGYLAGLFYGGHLGRWYKRPRVSFTLPFVEVPRQHARLVRAAAVVSLVGMVGSFKLMGYVPLLAANRQLAKYGVGPYKAGFDRGAQVLHLAMGLASVVAAVLLAFVLVRRRAIDVVLLIALLAALAGTLSRGLALIGPLTFFVAMGVERHWRAWVLVGVAFLSFVGATFLNELFLAKGAPVASSTFAERAAGSAPDVSDQLGFLIGFELQGAEHVGTKTIQAGGGLSLHKGYWDPADYALRMRTGLSDATELASGGLRLPAPIWGYAAYGYPGVVAWSFVSGVFVGWGTGLLRKLLAGIEAGGYPHQSLNLVLAWVFYNGTFGILSQFYFPFRSDILVLALAVGLCLWPVRRRLLVPERDESLAT